MNPKPWLLAFSIVVVPSLLWAQPGPSAARPEQASELRSQIDRLEQKLRTLEATDKERRGIAQIGNTTVRAADESRLVVRMYDLSELFTVAPPYEAKQTSDLVASEKNIFPQAPSHAMATSGMGGFGGGFGGAFSVPDRPASVKSQRPAHLAQVETRTSTNNLIEAIQATISPTSWDTVGGSMSISQLGNALLVSADANTHSQIENLLDLFHKRWGTLKTVSVRAWLMPLTEDQLNELLSPASATAGERSAFGLVDEVAFAKRLAAQNQSDEQVGYRATVTCYNGQTVSTVAGDQSLAVTDLRPVSGKADANTPGPIAYAPTVSLIQEGAAIQVTPIVTTSGKYVVLDVHSRVHRRLADEPRARAAGARNDATRRPESNPTPDQVVAALDRPKLAVHRMSTTLRVPIGRTMLIGGMTIDKTPSVEDPTLYLFVKLFVQELRDDAKDQSNDTDEQADKAPRPTSEADDAGVRQ